MQVNVVSRHGTLRPETREHITSRSEGLLTYFERITQIDVTVDFDHDSVEVELLVDAEHKHNFVAKADGDDATTVFDAALHKMEHQIRRYKEKLQDHRRDTPVREIASESEE